MDSVQKIPNSLLDGIERFNLECGTSEERWMVVAYFYQMGRVNRQPQQGPKQSLGCLSAESANVTIPSISDPGEPNFEK